MNNQMSTFASAWGRLWQSRIRETDPTGTIADPLRVDDTPAYPLARTVPMPEDHAYETGAISFRMADLALSGLARLDQERSDASTDGDRIKLKLVLDGIRLDGRYSLDVKPDPIIKVDTAGNLMDLPPEVCDPRAGGSDTDPGGALDPQKEQWLDQAREQRTKLSQTDNGQKLLGLYGEHNETYDNVFRTNTALVPLWQNGGVTRDMASDTSTAVQANGVVNSSDKTYANGNTYNGNAFVQQLTVASACVWTDPDFDPATGPPPGSKFWDAAKAALSFGKGVNQNTGNSKDNVNEMTPTAVYGTVDSAPPTLPAVADTEMGQVIAMGVTPGGADEEPVDLGWIVVDEETRQRLHGLYEATMRQKAEDASIVGVPFFTGSCQASLDRIEATLELAVETTPEGLRVRALSADVDLPAFELDLDDADWSGEIALIARNRLDRMYFIRSLLHQSIAARLRGALLAAAEGAYNDTLRGS